MEFFENAHVLKNKYVSKKETKTENRVKKQLKQMLYGYKKSDNELIRKSENVIDDFDSASVSSFSDLDLTSSDNGTTKATLDSSDLDSVSNLTEEGVDSSSKISFVEGISVNKDSSELIGIDDLISDNNSEKEESSDALEESNTSLLLSEDLSSLCSSVESESSSSNVFDVDGALASKIHERLKNIKNDSEDKLKRKFTENTIVTEDKQGSGDEHLQSTKDKHEIRL
ncbi:unnamed protein product [Parnassius apollo]|uniref:(apollo) hypothetical protein n=1 Tax=Parnassius apollo TaxID=110799 RepID=A0A8S3X573_PARAO|nr:unnamed protein product [Parnassius apollo]